MNKLCTIFLAFALVIPLGVLADTYSYETIYVPGSQYTWPYGINDRGQVVGWCFIDIDDGHLHDRGFLYENGEFQFLYGMGLHGMAWATDINNHGQIVGGGFTGEGVLYEDGEYYDFSYPDGWGTQPYSINDRGQIVGTYWKDYIHSPPYHGFLYENGQFQTIDYPGASDTYATGINDRGQIVVNGLIYANGEFKSNKCQVSATGINNSGDTVGGSFLCKNRKLQPLNYPGTTGGIEAYDINNRGQIVGSYGNQGFIATRTWRAPSVSGSRSEVTTTWAAIKSK